MKKMTTLLLLTVSLASFGQMDTVTSKEDLIYGKSTTANPEMTYYLKGQDQPFTGVFVQLDFRGHKSHLETYENGKLHGNYITYRWDWDLEKPVAVETKVYKRNQEL